MNRLQSLVVLLLLSTSLFANADGRQSVEDLLRRNGVNDASEAIALGLHSSEDVLTRFGAEENGQPLQESPLDQITMTFAGSTLFSGLGEVSVYGNYAYCSMQYGFHIIDISDPADPQFVAEVYTPGAGGIAVSGSYAYVTACGNGISVFDISSPVSPVQVANLSGFCCPSQIMIEGNLAFVTDGCALRIVDISTPTAPSLIATHVTPGSAQSLTVIGNLVYIADGSDGLQIVDVATPASPTLVGSVDTPVFARDIAVASGKAYIADSEGGLQIADVSIPSAPAIVGAYLASEGAVTQVVVIAGVVHIAVFFGGIQSIDVNVPSAPVKISDYNVGGYNILAALFGSGSHVFAGTGDQLHIIDVSDPDGPSKLGSFDSPNYAFGVSRNGNYSVLCDLDSVFVLDVTVLSNPVRIAAFVTPNDPHDVEYIGNHAYIADGDAGLLVYDLTTPSSPSLLASLPLPGRSVRLFRSGSRMYVSSLGGGLNIVNIATPSAPTLLGTIDTPDEASSVSVVGNTAYIADRFDGFLIYDITTPAAAVQIGGLDTPGECTGIAVQGSFAYVADGAEGLLVYNISVPATPVLTDQFNTPWLANQVLVIGSTLYLVDFDGIYVFDISVPATPVNTGFYKANCDASRDFSLSANIGLIAQGNCGLFVVDFGAMPGGPVRKGIYLTPFKANRMAASGNYAFAASGTYDMAVIDISSPSSPQVVAKWDPQAYYSDAADIQIIGTRAYLAGNGLQILNIATPTSPTLLGRLDFCCFDGIEVFGSYAYLAAREQGLVIVDISNEASPTVVGSYDTPGYAYDVVKLGTNVVISDQDSGIVVINVTNPSAPTFVSRYQTSTRSWSLKSNGSYIHIGTSSPSSGILTLDLSVPAVPKFANFVPQFFEGCPCAMDMSNGYLYVGGGYYGGNVSAFNVAEPANPSFAGYATTHGDANGVAVSGSKVIVGDAVAVAVYVSTVDTTATLARKPVAMFLSAPVFATAPPNDTTRLFVVELPGTIRLIKNGLLQPSPFLDITGLTCDGGDVGLLGLAFDPNYQSNGYFYVRYNDNNCNVQISRFTRSGNPDLANSASEQLILNIDQPDSPNHNAGSIFFGQDNYLYIPNGDGTCCGDPENDAQNPTNMLGKMLRIDVHSGSPYAVPPDNPFVGVVDTLPEIWSFGLRNPYRCSVDRETGDIYLADVGQDAIEEIDFQPAASTGGENYGWPVMEADACYNPPSGCNTSGLQIPVHQYLHEDGKCSITGGYVYRGCAIPELQGRYVFGDFCTGQIWSLTHNGTSVTNLTNHSADIESPDFSLVGFGEDAAGELYVCDLNSGSVAKIVPRGVAPAVCAGSYTCGDADGNDLITISDAVYLINYIFAGGPAPSPLIAGDCDCNSIITISDAVYLINYIFSGGPAPCAACP